MCNCIEETKDSLKIYYDAKEGVEGVTDVTLENTAIMFGDGSTSGVELYSEVKIAYKYRNKKDELKIKKEKVNMSYRYCPFCGQSYKNTNNESEEK